MQHNTMSLIHERDELKLANEALRARVAQLEQSELVALTRHADTLAGDLAEAINLLRLWHNNTGTPGPATGALLARLRGGGLEQSEPVALVRRFDVASALLHQISSDVNADITGDLADTLYQWCRENPSP